MLLSPVLRPGIPGSRPGAECPDFLRFQSTWPANDIFHEFARDYAQKVNDTAGGQLKIEVLPAGAVVKAFDLLDAVSAGTLDGGHGVVAYWYGKNTAVALWGSGPSFGMDANMPRFAWHEYGGGKEPLTEIQKAAGVNVVSLMAGRCCRPSLSAGSSAPSPRWTRSRAPFRHRAGHRHVHGHGRGGERAARRRNRARR